MGILKDKSYQNSSKWKIKHKIIKPKAFFKKKSVYLMKLALMIKKKDEKQGLTIIWMKMEVPYCILQVLKG